MLSTFAFALIYAAALIATGTSTYGFAAHANKHPERSNRLMIGALALVFLLILVAAIVLTVEYF